MLTLWRVTHYDYASDTSMEERFTSQREAIKYALSLLGDHPPCTFNRAPLTPGYAPRALRAGGAVYWFPDGAEQTVDVTRDRAYQRASELA